MSNPDGGPVSPQHVPMTQFPVRDNCLQVGDRALTEIAAELGTPFYAYDAAVMTAQVARLRTALPDCICTTR